MGPSAIRAGMAALVGLLIAHAEWLAKLGIVYDQATNTVLFHLTTLSVWAGTAGIGLIAALFMGAQHHTVAAITGAPQTGEKPMGGPTS